MCACYECNSNSTTARQHALCWKMRIQQEHASGRAEFLLSNPEALTCESSGTLRAWSGIPCPTPAPSCWRAWRWALGRRRRRRQRRPRRMRRRRRGTHCGLTPQVPLRRCAQSAATGRRWTPWCRCVCRKLQGSLCETLNPTGKRMQEALQLHQVRILWRFCTARGELFARVNALEGVCMQE